MSTAWLKDVIGYGTHAARPAAGSAGALYYETDTDTLLRDNGSTWDALTLGSGSPLTTKGDVFVYGSSDARLPVGTDGQVLTADSTQALGLKWAAGGAGGALPTQSAYLGADVAMTTVNTIYDAVSLSLAAGTWLLFGYLTYETPTTTDQAVALIRTAGGTVSSSGQTFLATTNTGATIPVAALVTPGSTTTYKLSAIANDASATIKAATTVNGQGNNATYLLALKVA